MTPQCVKQNVLTKHTNAKTGLLFCAFSQWCIGGTAKRLGLLLVVVLGARHSSSISTTQVVSRGCPTIYPPLSFSIYFSISLSLSLSLSLSCSIYLSLPLYLSLSLPSFWDMSHITTDTAGDTACHRPIQINMQASLRHPQWRERNWLSG
jgi:hypothetical protein